MQRFRKILAMTAALSMGLASFSAYADGLSVSELQESVHPGKAVILSFRSESEGIAHISLKDANGQEVMTVIENFSVQPGLNRMYWNGTNNGVYAPEGEYRLTVMMGDETADAAISISEPAPVISNVSFPEELETQKDAIIAFQVSQNGTVTVMLEQGEALIEVAFNHVAAGNASLKIEAGTIKADLFSDGEASLIFSMENDDGISSTTEYYGVTLTGLSKKDALTMTAEEPTTEALTVDNQLAAEMVEEEKSETVESSETTAEETAVPAENDQHQYTPSYGTPYPITESEAGTYWGLPMDITDEEAVWNMLIQPITVVSTGSKCTEKTQVTIREEPDSQAAGVGVVTCLTQSVRVIEKGEEWSLIECYSSSFHDSKILAWNMLVQGWIPTGYLKTVTPSDKIGLVVDKLTQRMYVFVEGKLYTTLLVSTGLANEKQPYNETRSGEFVLVTVDRVGGFPSDNMYCAMGIRFNGGDLLHEVPYTLNKDGSKNYSTCEAKLGTRASHGCIRVQRRKTPEGVNMKWIWDNVKKNTKIVIWEDWQGRRMDYPADDLQVYYNPNGGQYYHSASSCYMATKVTFEPLNYGQLE